MLNLLLFIFITSIIGILVICFFFLNTDIEKEQEERAKREAAEAQKKNSLKNEAVEDITFKNNETESKIDESDEVNVKNKISEKEESLLEQIKQLEENLCEKDVRIKFLQTELEQEKLNSQEQIKKKIDEVIRNFEPKIIELINKSEEKVDRLLEINEELYENTRRQTKQESEMLNFRNHMVDKMDQVMRTLEKSSYESIYKPQESDDHSLTDTT